MTDRKSKGASTNEVLWRRLNQLDRKLGDTLMEFAEETFGSGIFAEAWAAYTGDEGPDEPSEMDLNSFLPWMFYAFDTAPRRTRALNGPAATVAGAYVNKNRSQLSDLEARYLEACAHAPYRLWQVVAVEPGYGCQVADFLTGATFWVSERMGTLSIENGDVVYGQVITFDGLSLFSGLGSLTIPPREQIPLIDLRIWIRRRHKELTESLWFTHAEDVRLTYLELRDHLLNPPTPIFQNTDGELLEPRELFFTLSDPGAAFEALRSLQTCDGKLDQELPEAELDSKGVFRSGEIEWLGRGNKQMKSWENTVLGRLYFEKNELRAEVNSKARAERLKALLEKRLGALGKWTRTVEVDLEEALNKATASHPEQERLEEAILEDPEARAELFKALQRQYEHWIDQKIPALGGKTPRKAVKDIDGRAKVQALLKAMEQEPPGGPPGFKPDVGPIRRALGLL